MFYFVILYVIVVATFEKIWAFDDLGFLSQSALKVSKPQFFNLKLRLETLYFLKQRAERDSFEFYEFF